MKLKDRFLDWLSFQIAGKISDFVSDPKNFQTLGLGISSVVAALFAVAYAWLFRLAEQGFLFLLGYLSYAILFVTPLLFLLGWWIVYRFAPEAAGSGIPQIMAANEIEYRDENCRTVDRLLSIRTALVKVASSVLCVLGGGAIGREGPTLQISTSIFHYFAGWVRKVNPNMTQHTWVVAGAAAGLAAAFNTPLGGIVYAIEELGLVHFHKVRTALLSGVILSGIVAQWILGSYLFLGFPPLAKSGFSFLPFAVLNGLISGLLGALFGKILLGLLRKRLAHQNVKGLATVTLLSGVIMASFCLIDNRASGSGVHLVTEFLFKGEKSDAVLFLFRFFGSIFTYLSGAAGGIFSASLTVGASIGSLMSNFFGSSNVNLMILLGMIGFLTGVTRTPFTSFILVLEMTDRHSAIFPMMLAALAAQRIASLVDKNSFYEHVKLMYLHRSLNTERK